jgi:hypothetical protein
LKALGGCLYDNELLQLKLSLPAEVQTEVIALRIGDGVLAGVPAEYFIEYQIALKRESPHPLTFLAAAVNDWIGYAPTREAFAEGGYETKLARWSKLAEDSGDVIYEAVLGLAKAI